MVRRENLRGAVAVTVDGSLSPPPLRMEIAGGGRMLLRQSGNPILLARVDDDHSGVRIHRRPGFRSPLPPLSAELCRRGPDWLHRFADHLITAHNGPLHAGRTLLRSKPALAPSTWTRELFHSWPTAYVDWMVGCTPIIPLRPLSAVDAPRVKAYRRRCREGIVPPVLLWWVSAFDGWLLLDGHDRAVAALAEGREPAAVVLSRGADVREQTAVITAVARHQEHVLTRASDPRAEEVFSRQLARVAAGMPYESGRTVAWPLPGGIAVWDELRHAFPA
ncbi:hypothetical protein [Nocardia paucivorans]|uniref:hypothetical protein n=1 Tax=Nocardia paucivorans TaxID=114259 RepID=UPI0012FCE023|nr:hypothetical protein [Nocardia paucivorans]